MTAMFFTGKVTTDKQFIKQWIETRNGFPAIRMEISDANIIETLTIGFPGCINYQDFHEITWDEFFERFDRSRLAFLYQDLPVVDTLDQTYRFL